MALLTRLSDALRKAIKFFPGSKAANRELGQLLQTLAALNATVSVDSGNTKITLGSGVALELAGNATRLRLVTGADLLFDGTSGQNKVVVTENLANALEFQDAAGNNLFRLQTTTGSLLLRVDANAQLNGIVQLPNAGLIGGELAVQVGATPYTVASADSGKVFYTMIADVVFNLPSSAAASLDGLVYTFVNNSVSGGTGLSINPAAPDMIEGKGITPAANKDYINDGATDAVGDLVKLIGTPSGWLVLAERGTWSREA